MDLGKYGVKYESKNSICLEIQYSPNSINYSRLESPLLKADEEYFHTIIYKFII